MQNSVLLDLPEGNNRGVEAEGEEEGKKVWLECLVFPSNGFQLCAGKVTDQALREEQLLVAAGSGGGRGHLSCGVIPSQKQTPAMLMLLLLLPLLTRMLLSRAKQLPLWKPLSSTSRRVRQVWREGGGGWGRGTAVAD